MKTEFWDAMPAPPVTPFEIPSKCPEHPGEHQPCLTACTWSVETCRERLGKRSPFWEDIKKPPKSRRKNDLTCPDHPPTCRSSTRLTCEKCKGDFWRENHRIEQVMEKAHGKTLCTECMKLVYANRRVEKVCEVCGKTYLGVPKGHTCGPECRGVRRKSMGSRGAKRRVTG